jgi:hypothetical protein
MVNRWIGILSILLALIANGALFWRHVVPHLMAGEPPTVPADGLKEGEVRQIQVGVYNADHILIGRSWTVADRSSLIVTVRSLTVLEPTRLPNGMETIPLAINSVIDFHAEGHPEEMKIEILGLGFNALLRGEYFSGNFPCRWEFGGQSGSFLVDSELLHTMRDTVRPFDRLPGLYVGQSWEVGLFDPFSKIFKLRQSGLGIEKMLVEVVGREEIVHPHSGELVKAFRVEAPQVTAWVEPDGRVLRQEVRLPILGKLSVVDEPFDERAYIQALQTWTGKNHFWIPPEEQGDF